MVSKINQKPYTKTTDSENENKLQKSVYVIAQEIKIAKSLAGNDQRQRAKQLKKLRKWLKIRSNSSFSFSDDDFLRIWKGLHYSMWMADKPLVQEALAEDLGALLNCFENITTSIQFFGAFLKTMVTEWFGIDQWRIDKFMMMVRRIFRHMFFLLKSEKWSDENIEDFAGQLSSSVLSGSEAIGLKMHITDIYLEEVAKVSNGKISAHSVALLVKPFVYFLATRKDNKLMHHIRKHIFYHLLFQSDQGRAYTEKYDAWKEMGFPTKSIDDLEKVEDEVSDEEAVDEKEDTQEGERVLDPRAGHVDVLMPIIPVDAEAIIADIESIMYKEITNTKSRRFLKQILEKYKTFNSGEFPLGIKTVPKFDLEPINPLIENKVKDLEKIEEELYGTTRQIKKLSKKKRKRLLTSINFDEYDITEENFENIVANALPHKKQRMNDDWKEEDIIINPNVQEKKLVTNGKINKKQKSAVLLALNKDKSKIKKVKSLKPNVKQNHLEILKDMPIIGKENTIKENPLATVSSEWEQPLQDGEIEYFVPSRKLKLKSANQELSKEKQISTPAKNLVPNPFALKSSSAEKKSPKTPKTSLLGKSARKSMHGRHLLKNPTSSEKKVKIMLHKNMSQNASEYIKQVKNSPKVPYDSNKKPTKGLLKPNLMPSPINPFYKKKIGLKLNDTP